MWPIINQYFCAIVMMIGVYIFTKVSLNTKIKISKKKFLILIQFVYILHVIVYFNLFGLAKTIIMFLIDVIFCSCAFKISIKKSMFLIFVYLVLLIIPDLLQLFIATEILGISKSFYYNKFAGGLLSNIFVCIAFLILIFFIKKPLRWLTATKIDNNLKVVIFSILTLFSILLFFYTIILEFRFSNDVLIYLVAMIVMLLVLSTLIKQTIENNKITKKYDKLLEFMTTYENEIERQRILRHEVKNEFLTIRAKICDKEKNEKVIKYIDDILEEKIKVNQEKYAKFGYLPPNGIKGLCYFKVQEAEEKGIAVSLSITKKIKDSVIYDFDIKQQRNFGKILGVILDNAIEASKESEKKQMGMQAYVNTKKEFRMIISNSFDNKVDETKIGKEVFSTKGKNRGHGLLLVKSIIDKNDMFDIKTEIQDDIYTQTIIVKNTIKN